MTLIIVIAGGIVAWWASLNNISPSARVLFFALWFIAIGICYTANKIEKFIHAKDIETLAAKVAKEAKDAVSYMNDQEEKRKELHKEIMKTLNERFGANKDDTTS